MSTVSHYHYSHFESLSSIKRAFRSLKGTISADQWPFDCNKLPKYIDPKTNQNAEICGFEGEKSNSIFESEENPKNSICTNELDCPGLLKTGMRTNHFFFGLPDCAPPCKGHFWSDDEIQLSRKWILAWSTFCLISTLFTVSTYLIDRDRFRYPERPIVFLAACYMIISCVHITGYFMEDEVACYDNIAQQDTTWSFYSTNPTSIIEQVRIREESSAHNTQQTIKCCKISETIILGNKKTIMYSPFHDFIFRNNVFFYMVASFMRQLVFIRCFKMVW